MSDKERFHFRIDAFTPDTIPMVRLAQYLACLSEMYGNQDDLRFKGLTKGSAVLRVETSQGVAAQIRERLFSLNATAGAGPAPAPALLRSYNNINNLLIEDNAVAAIRQPKGAKILAFPGRKSVKKQEKIAIVQHTVIDGVVVRIGGRDATIPVWVRDQENRIIHCTIRGNENARALSAYYLGNPLRISGRANWVRDENGQWSFADLNIQSFEEIEDVPLLEIFENLREIQGIGWREMENPIEYWESIRGG